jgi:GDPmannose 4,6-dehydratase
MKRAFITGITGQDGSYLAEHLLKAGYKVTGAIRRSSTTNVERISHLLNDIELVNVDLGDQGSIINAINKASPDEVYNLAAQSFVTVSWEEPTLTGDYTALGVTRVLEALKTLGGKARFYQASSSEMFGKVQEVPQTETTPLYPRSPYGVAKVYGHWITVNYRESYGMYACSGILFNHESPRRGLEFVTRKISSSVAKIRTGGLDKLEIGNMNSKRDWGFAGDYVRAMQLMLNQSHPDDYVVSTGVTHSVREFCDLAFKVAGYSIEWQGEGEHEKGIDKKSGKVLVCVNERWYRPAEVDFLIGNPAKAKRTLGWKPEVDFQGLVTMMVEADLAIETEKR